MLLLVVHAPGYMQLILCEFSSQLNFVICVIAVGMMYKTVLSQSQFLGTNYKIDERVHE